MTYAEIITATTDALARRDSRRDVLAARITEIADSARDAARIRELVGPGWRIETRALGAQCGQWGNGADDSWHEEAHTVLVVEAEARTLGPVPDVGWHDGHNMRHQHGPTKDATTRTVVRPATVAQLRAVARELPGVVAHALAAATERAELERQAADAALSAL